MYALQACPTRYCTTAEAAAVQGWLRLRPVMVEGRCEGLTVCRCVRGRRAEVCGGALYVRAPDSQAPSLGDGQQQWGSLCQGHSRRQAAVGGGGLIPSHPERLQASRAGCEAEGFGNQLGALEGYGMCMVLSAGWVCGGANGALGLVTDL